MRRTKASDDITFSQYSEEAQKSQRFREGEDALQYLTFGYFGEVGGLLAALKKASRDSLLETDHDFACEELGDALWYLVAVSNAHGIKPADLGSEALGALRKHYREQSRPYKSEVTAKNLDAMIQAQVDGRATDRSELLSTLAAAAGELVATTGPQKDIRGPASVEEFLGLQLSLIARTAASFDLNLVDVARLNLAKIADRWPASGTDYVGHFDQASEYPDYERLPRQFTVEFNERIKKNQKYVVQSIKGIFIGDPLTDNNIENDGYRFHDVFHLAYVAHLGWSPVIRGLLKRKRKSKPDVDENQDGARAMIIEEGIATWIFNHGVARGDYFENVQHGQLAFGLLKQIRQMVKGYEVDQCPLWQWENAILDGFRIFRQLLAAGKGVVHVDMDAHTLTFAPISTEE